MAIKTTCEECGKTYSVKDELAGKKIRCKQCANLILVPSESEDDWDETVEDEPLPLPKKSSKKKSRRRSSSDGMPPSIIIALVCTGFMIAITALDLVSTIRFIAMVPARPPQLIGMALGGLLRGAIQLAIFFGVMNGTASTRIISIVLAGLASIALVVQLLRPPVVAGPLQDYITIILGLSLLVRVVFVGCMVTPSAGDHMSR